LTQIQHIHIYLLYSLIDYHGVFFNWLSRGILELIITGYSLIGYHGVFFNWLSRGIL